MPFPFTRSSRDVAPTPASPTSTSGSSSFITAPLAIAHPVVLLEPPQEESGEGDPGSAHPEEEGVVDPNEVVPADPGDEAVDELAGPSHIEISDAILDPHPFDPSYCDEQWYITLQEAARAQSTDITRRSPTAAAAVRFLARHRRPGPSRSTSGIFTRVFGGGGGNNGGGGGGGGGSPGSPSETGATPAPGILASPSSPGSAWRMNLARHRRSSTVGAPLMEGDEEDDNETAGGVGHERNRRAAVQEPGVLLHASSPQKWGLVPLQEAQERSDIIRRVEGFEMLPGSSVHE
ncbi:hypothetical protein BDY19DRAFT_468910 [Irpex rosettiformis]|uniref:Uncharacterized protein n=1 Tax=Irpex rosettiformis TaxID=378272 RepID=A0ACB8TSL5_9APHY|nr:hypothetical protein BDY19DRAFT_468910 [Irpex rosettiformis]